MEREQATFTMEQIREIESQGAAGSGSVDHSGNRLTDTLCKMKLLQ
jgi:hypothetical protein